MSKKMARLKKMFKVSNLTPHEQIDHKNYAKDDKMVWIGEMVEKQLKKIQKDFGSDVVNLSRYSPFQYVDLEYPDLGFAKHYGKRIPTWQVWMWEHFLNKDGELDFNSFSNSILFINKPKKVGNTYTIAHLVSALMLTDQIENAIAGAANMQWLTSFFMPAMRRIFPQLSPNAGKKSGAKTAVFSSSEKMFFIHDNEMKVVGMDSQKRRMKGHKAKFAFLDETASIKNYELIYETLLNPILRTRGGIILGGTPDPDSGQWFDDIFQKAVKKEGVYSGLNVHALKFNIYESGMWSEKRIDEMMLLEYNASTSLYPEATEEYVLTQLAQENFNHFIPRVGVASIGYNFIRNEENVAYPSEAFQITKDYGESIYDSMAALFFAYDNDATYHIIGEWEEYDSSISSCVNNVIGTWERWGIDHNLVTHYCDRNSHVKRFKTNDGYALKLKDRFLQAGLYTIPATNIPKLERLDLMNRMFENQTGVWHPFQKRYGCPQLLVSNSCPKLIKSFKTLKLDWTESTKSLARQFQVMKNDHLLDSLTQIVPFFNHIERMSPKTKQTMFENKVKAKKDAGFKVI